MTATLLETSYETSRWSLVPIFVCYLYAGIVFRTINTEEAKAAAAGERGTVSVTRRGVRCVDLVLFPCQVCLAC